MPLPQKTKTTVDLGFSPQLVRAIALHEAVAFRASPEYTVNPASVLETADLFVKYLTEGKTDVEED